MLLTSAPYTSGQSWVDSPWSKESRRLTGRAMDGTQNGPENPRSHLDGKVNYNNGQTLGFSHGSLPRKSSAKTICPVAIQAAFSNSTL